MVFREVSVIEIREVLRSWLAGAGLRTVAAPAGAEQTFRSWFMHAEYTMFRFLEENGST